MAENDSQQSKLYRYGELYWVEFDEETVGTEIRGPRPGLIISDNSYNQISERVIALPCSRTLNLLYSFELFIPKLANEINGKIMIDQIQSIDKERIGDKIRNLTAEEMNKVVEKLRKILPFAGNVKSQVIKLIIISIKNKTMNDLEKKLKEKLNYPQQKNLKYQVLAPAAGLYLYKIIYGKTKNFMYE